MGRSWWWVLVIGALVALGGYKIMASRMTGPRWDRLLPKTKLSALALIRAAQAAGLRIMFFDGWRDPDASAANIKAGASRLADPLNSFHVWGAAFDVAFVNALGLPEWPADTDPRWRQLANLARSQGLFSGGLNWGWDWGHFQLANIKIADLRKQHGDRYLAYLQQNGAMVA